MAYNLFVLFCIVALLIYYKGGYKNEKCINSIFFAAWVIFSIEYYTTKDYVVYYENFHRIGEHIIWEPIYRFLLKIAQPIGFIPFNSMVAAFEMFTLCVIFKKVIPPKFMWVGVLILILDTSELFIFMNVKRQFFAMMISMWIFYFMAYSSSRLRYVYAIAMFLIAINVHTVAYISVLYFFVPLLRFRFGWLAIASILALYMAAFTFRLSELSEMMFGALDLLLSDDSDRYSRYIQEQGEYEDMEIAKAMFNSIFDISLMVLLLLYNKRFTQHQFNVAFFAIIGLFLGNILKGNIARANYFFDIFALFSVPIVLSYLRNDSRVLIRKWLYYGMLLLSLALPVKSYYNAMSGTKVTFMTYKYRYFYTIFDKNPDKTDYLFD